MMYQMFVFKTNKGNSDNFMKNVREVMAHNNICFNRE